MFYRELKERAGLEKLDSGISDKSCSKIGNLGYQTFSQSLIAPYRANGEAEIG
ncbi:hypothetical protein BMS3Bbin05_01858 [bacterium BMS3Bbin05]|nr:hypothetical protein BMS3Bbin05_01858 [bacterium BMS3Bbin05]